MGNYVPAIAAPKSPEESRFVTRYNVENSNVTATATIDNEHLRLAIQSLDALISKAVAEKTLQYQQQQQQHLPLSSTLLKSQNDEKECFKIESESTPKQAPFVNTELMTAFAASLANVLAGHSGQLNSLVNTSCHSLPARRSSSVSSSPLYRCPMDSHNNPNCQLETGASSFSPDMAATSSSFSSKVNYKNLFPRNPSLSSAVSSPLTSSAAENSTVDVNSLFQETGLLGQALQQAATSENRRMSNALVEIMANSMIGSGNGSSGGSLNDTVRINLPEILDAQDEIILLRLLIKLLSGKVTKLSDEKRRLLASISHLSDINAEMAMLIERGIQK